MNKNWNVWVITGASSGIGKAFVEYILTELKIDPGSVLCIGRSSCKLEQLRSVGGKDLRLLPMDISNYDSNYYHLKKTLAGDKISNLINCAGLCHKPTSFRERDFESIVYETQTNLLGTLSLVHGALKLWNKEEKGHIMCVSSPIGKVPIPSYATYSASKAALISFSECLREELEQTTKINVSCILPTLTTTEMTKEGMKPSRFIYPLEATYVAKQMANLVLNSHSGVKSIGLQAEVAVAVQRVSPFINKLFL